MAIALNKKSGTGRVHGVASELTAFSTIKPGHANDLRAALERFQERAQPRDRSVFERLGLRTQRHVIFDNDRRVMWSTAFESDWDPYPDDALLLVGVQPFIDWMQHTMEAEEKLIPWIQQSGGADALSKGANSPELQELVKRSSGGLKQIIQSVQVPGTAYWNMLSDQTVPQIRKAQRVEQAFQQVLDDPAAEQALQQPALKPLLEQAAD